MYGRPIRIKTEEDIYDSYISAISLNDENFVCFKSGSLRNTLLDKLKKDNNALQRQSVVNSLNSISESDALSAAKGKELNEKFNKKYYGVRSAAYLFATKQISPSGTNAGTLTLFVNNLDFYDKGIAGFVNIDRDGTMYVSTISPTSQFLSSYQKKFWVLKDENYFYCFVQVPNYNDNWFIEVLDKTGLFNLQWTKYSEDEFSKFKETHQIVSNKGASIQGTIQRTFPSLLNGWTAYTSGGNKLSKTNNIVTLQLTVKSGTANNICQLPAVYCPQHDAYFPVNNLSDKSASVILITSSGYVRAESNDIGKSIFANVSFLTN